VGAPFADASTFVVFKLGQQATSTNEISGDEYTFWANNGGFNEGNATAASVSNDTLDYKDSWVDSAINWSSVISVNVGMYVRGVEQAYINFTPGSDKLTFFTSGNITSTSYTDLSTLFTGNFFAEAGDGAYNRRWFVNQNYGGCGSDTGWFVVEDATSSRPCSWETDRTVNSRDFLYATGNTQQNWNSVDVGTAEVFAITVTTATPEPATFGFIGAALVCLSSVSRKRRRS